MPLQRQRKAPEAQQPQAIAGMGVMPWPDGMGLENYSFSQYANLKKALAADNNWVHEEITRTTEQGRQEFVSFSQMREIRKTYASVEKVDREYVPTLSDAAAIAAGVAKKVAGMEGLPYYIVQPITIERVDKQEYLETNHALVQKLPAQIGKILSTKYGINAHVVGEQAWLTGESLAQMLNGNNWKEIKRALIEDATDINNKRFFSGFGAVGNSGMQQNILQKILNSSNLEGFRSAVGAMGGEGIYFPSHLHTPEVEECYAKLRQASVSYKYEIFVDKVSGQPKVKVGGGENLNRAQLQQIYLQLDGMQVRVGGQELSFRFEKMSRDLCLVDAKNNAVSVFEMLDAGESALLEVKNSSGAWEPALKVVREPRKSEGEEPASVEEAKDQQEEIVEKIIQSDRRIDMVMSTDESGSMSYWVGDAEDAANYIIGRFGGKKVKGKTIEIEGSRRQYEYYLSTLEHQIEEWEIEEKMYGPRPLSRMPERHFGWVGDGFGDDRHGEWFFGNYDKAVELIERAKKVNARVHFVEIGEPLPKTEEDYSWLLPGKQEELEFDFGTWETKFELQSAKKDLENALYWAKQYMEWGNEFLEKGGDFALQTAEEYFQDANQKLKEAEGYGEKIAILEKRVKQRREEKTDSLGKENKRKKKVVELLNKAGAKGFKVLLLRKIADETGGICINHRGAEPGFFSRGMGREKLVLELLKMMAGEEFELAEEKTLEQRASSKYLAMGARELERAWEGAQGMPSWERLSLIDEMVAKNANLNIADKGEFSPLAYCAREADLQRVGKLLENGADPNFMLGSAQNPVYLAVEGYPAQKEKSIQMLKMFFENKKNPAKAGVEGLENPPFHLAVGRGYEEVADLFLENGENPEVRDNRHFSALNYNITGKNKEIIEKVGEIILLEKYWLDEKGLAPVVDWAQKIDPEFAQADDAKKEQIIHEALGRGRNISFEANMPGAGGAWTYFLSPKQVVQMQKGDCDEISLLEANADNVLANVPLENMYIVSIYANAQIIPKGGGEAKSDKISHSFLLKNTGGKWVMSDALNSIFEQVPDELFADMQKMAQWCANNYMEHYAGAQGHNARVSGGEVKVEWKFSDGVPFKAEPVPTYGARNINTARIIEERR
ncbi:hypothetical protein COU37_01405 [Candidatus Micrarchaeota archaeon CG10_big_fil_rev_8_21_14_0_10_45_29]|nr:MAG: hypothetical protein COU37_01405 [Candidatus Micrarchaeota archaeon CG10_big_fil_rev_8_21_14_0_10_45_29]